MVGHDGQTWFITMESALHLMFFLWLTIKKHARQSNAMKYHGDHGKTFHLGQIAEIKTFASCCYLFSKSNL